MGPKTLAPINNNLPQQPFGSKAHLWENFRASIIMLIIEDWAQLMDLMLRPDDCEVMESKKI
jgi:hypothetical protein